MKEVYLKTLREWLDAKAEFSLVDARGTDTYAQGHIPKAVSLPTGKVTHHHETLFPGKESRIVVYCSNPACHASLEVSKLLEDLGYTDIWHYAGGMEEWQIEDLPVESP